MSMTKVHYEQIAEVLGKFQAEMRIQEEQNFDTLVGDLCQVFAKDNPNFIAWRFISAIEKVSEALADESEA